MDSLLLIARVLLAAVFATASLTKLADRTGTRQTLRDFGVPPGLTDSLAILLPLAELAVAIALVPLATAWWGSLAACALLGLFIVGIGLNLARGRRPSCRCFGQIGAGPVGRSTLVRNGMLLVVAAFVAWQGRESPGLSVMGWAGALSLAEQVSLIASLAGLLLLGAVFVLLVQILGQQGRMLLRLDQLEQRIAAGGTAPSPGQSASAEPEGLPVGTLAPPFQLSDLQREEYSLDDLRGAPPTADGSPRTAKPLVLLFVDPDCGPCNALLPDVGRWQREHAIQLPIAVISRGTVEANRAKAAEHGVGPVLLQQDYEVADLYRVFATPSAVLVRADGTIASPIAGGPEQIRSLVGHALTAPPSQVWSPPMPLPLLDGHGHDHAHHQAAPPPLTIGETAPTVPLTDLDGTTFDLSVFRGNETLLLFWSPLCGFCRQLLPELVAWEQNLPPDAPTLLVVSSGPAELNREMGLRSQIVLDQEFKLGAAFGADGTPSAVLLDAEGRVTSELAVGGPRVLALAGVEPSSAGQVPL